MGLKGAIIRVASQAAMLEGAAGECEIGHADHL
jgi:hypothetical protein